MFEKTIIIVLFSRYYVDGRPTLSRIEDNKESSICLLMICISTPTMTFNDNLCDSQHVETILTLIQLTLMYAELESAINRSML